jgi:hypothetical protein
MSAENLMKVLVVFGIVLAVGAFVMWGWLTFARGGEEPELERSSESRRVEFLVLTANDQVMGRFYDTQAKPVLQLVGASWRCFQVPLERAMGSQVYYECVYDPEWVPPAPEEVQTDDADDAE